MAAGISEKVLKLAFLDRISVSGSSQRKIAQDLGISAGSVNQMLSDAVLGGSVDRSGDTPRTTRYELSATGKSERRRLAVELLVHDTPPYRIVRADLEARVRRLVSGGASTVGLVGSGPLLELTILTMLGALQIAGIAPQAAHGYPQLTLEAIDPNRVDAIVSVTNDPGAQLRRTAKARDVSLVFFT